MTEQERVQEELKRRCLLLLHQAAPQFFGTPEVVTYRVDLGDRWTLEKYDRRGAADDLVGDRLTEVFIISDINDITVFDMVNKPGGGGFDVELCDRVVCEGHVLPLMRRMMVLDDLSEVSDA